MRARRALAALALGLLLPAPVGWARVPRVRSVVVDATAYNSLPEQTGEDTSLSASGHRLAPGMRAIAVSPDLAVLGLVHGRKVRIDGLRGEWVVRDRMPGRWKRRIDVYMGEDLGAALSFGRRRVRIHWQQW
jgi:3D (Asp-Asp-Asp) domain-containing protein